MRRILRGMFDMTSGIVLVPLLFTVALVGRWHRHKRKDPVLMWGMVPIINNKYWSGALSNQYESITFVHGFYSSIHKKDDFDLYPTDLFGRVPKYWRMYFAEAYVFYKFDIVHISFRGLFLGHTIWGWLEPVLLKLANIKIVVLPIGSESYRYDRIRDVSLAHVLMISYPR
jgi:hypothetical protein